MHTPVIVHTFMPVCVCWTHCVNTSSTLHTNPLTVGKTVLHFPRCPIAHTHIHTHYAQYARFHLGVDTRDIHTLDIFYPRVLWPFLGSPMSTGMVVGATGQVSFDWQVPFSLSTTLFLDLFWALCALLCCCHETALQVNCFEPFLMYNVMAWISISSSSILKKIPK